jgi:hypothetical protein
MNELWGLSCRFGTRTSMGDHSREWDRAVRRQVRTGDHTPPRSSPPSWCEIIAAPLRRGCAGNHW